MPMAIASARGLVETLNRHRLLEAEQRDELERFLPSRPDDPLVLARELLQRGWLTPFQINRIFQGHAAELVLGHYVLLERLGEGGMGQVFKAREIRLGRIVALKVLRRERIRKPDIVHRFYQEIQACASLSHPNIVHAYDAEQIGDTHVFAMEYVEGIDLARLVKQNGPLPVEEACECIRQASIGLQHIHENGMVHRDIKPANLMRSKAGGIVKVLDMGLARLCDDEEGETQTKRLTRLGVVLGTIDFIAPEQAIDSRRADIRSDLYSLGCTFYYLLAGRPPFSGDDPMAKLLAHSCDAPIPLEQLCPEIPAKVSAIIEKLLAKRPEERYQTPDELIAALTALPPKPTREPEIVAITPPTTNENHEPSPFADLETNATAATTTTLHRPATTSWQGAPLWILGVGVLALIVVVVLVWLL
jgi:serine/threonine protein kinase